MKVKTNTPNLLIIEKNSWLLGVFSIVMIVLCAAMAIASVAFGTTLVWPMLACGAFFALAFVLVTRRSQLVLNANDGSLEIRQKSLFGYSAIRHDLDEISNASVETRKSIDGHTYSRMVLVIEHGQSEGRHPFPRAYQKWSAPAKMAQAVNDWLQFHRS